MELISHSLTQVLNLNPRAAACLSRLDGSPPSAASTREAAEFDPLGRLGREIPQFHLKRCARPARTRTRGQNDASVCPADTSFPAFRRLLLPQVL